MSEIPFCEDGMAAIDALDVWSDDRGVFVLAASAFSEHSIYFNAGNGWASYYRERGAPGIAALTGFRDGPLVQYGTVGCSIRFIEGGAFECSGAPSTVQHLFVVNEQLAYAVYQDRLLIYDGVQWTQHGSPLVPQGEVFATAVWASEEMAVVVGQEARVYLLVNGGMQPVAQSVPAGDYSAVWGFGPDEVWAGTRQGQLVQFDGQWRTVWRAPEACGAILGMWGDDGNLFFHTRNGLFVRRPSQEMQELLALPCGDGPEISSIWGNSSAEVFVSIRNSQANPGQCGATLMWFNGRSLSPL